MAGTTDYHVVDLKTTSGAFERLQAGARQAVEQRAERVLVDMSQVDPVDGAMLAVLSRMVQSLGSSARVALVLSAETLQFFAEWRLDSLWLLFVDRETAIAGLSR